MIGSLVDCPFACRIVLLFDEWGNALSGRNNGSQSRLCTICGMFVYNPCCCMKISALHVPVDVYIFGYRPAHEAFVDKRNSRSYGKRDLSLPLHGHLHEALCIIHEANCGLGVGGS